MKKPLLAAAVLLVLGGLLFGLFRLAGEDVSSGPESGGVVVTVSTPRPRKAGDPAPHVTNSNAALQLAFQLRQKNLQVSGEGVVSKLLTDDNDGSRHQRFVLRLSTGQTLMIAHNIDEPERRIPRLAKGDTVRFYGVYEWNEEGGTVHWTHRPGGSSGHVAGWLEHEGRKYQ
ncbi:hypothetical protein CVU37_02210 [candidate division BRC1 bacterium HGW-BRC1-1]|jgi:hypothetical protein|nr:MAG: hypothetical protein CVU37_02210 [candidate division BRC1 bacterium HGW-BRC1-1]